MKKLFGALLAVGLAAGSANAARIGIEWNPATSADVQNATVGVGGTAQMDMVADLIAMETLSTVAFEFNDEARLSLDGSNSTAIPDWATLATAGTLGAIGVNVAAASQNPLSTSISGPGSFVLGTYGISVDSGNVGDMIPITIDHTLNVTVLNSAGGAYSYDNRYAGPGGSLGDYSGYYAFGIGSPLTGTKAPQQPANPLNLTIPEPASLALLAIGGVALLRRR